MSAMGGFNPQVRPGSLMDQLAQIGLAKRQSVSQFQQEIVPNFMRDVQGDLSDDGQLNGSSIARAYAGAQPQVVQKNLSDYMEAVQADYADDRQLNGSSLIRAFFSARLQAEVAGDAVASQNPAEAYGQFGLNPRAFGTKEIYTLGASADNNMDGMVSPQELAQQQQFLNDRISFAQQYGGYLPAGVAQRRVQYFQRQQQVLNFVGANYNTLSSLDGQQGLSRNDLVGLVQRFGQSVQG
jgi:hypothetical protein